MCVRERPFNTGGGSGKLGGSGFFGTKGGGDFLSDPEGGVEFCFMSH